MGDVASCIDERKKNLVPDLLLNCVRQARSGPEPDWAKELAAWLLLVIGQKRQVVCQWSERLVPRDLAWVHRVLVVVESVQILW